MKYTWLGAALAVPVVALVAEAAVAVTNARFAGDAQLQSVAAGSKRLKNGSKGTGVEKVQGALTDMGFLIELPKVAQGLYGPNTRQGVVNFQRHVANRLPGRLKVNGTIDAATLAALDEMTPAPGKRGQVGFQLEPYYAGERIRALVVKSEHRTYLFDDQGIAEWFIDATGSRRKSSKSFTHTGLFRVTEILERKALADDKRFSPSSRRAAGAGWITTVPDDPRFSPRAKRFLKKYPQGLLGSSRAEEANGVLGGNRTSGPVKHRSQDMERILAAIKKGERVAYVENLSDKRIGQRPALTPVKAPPK